MTKLNRRPIDDATPAERMAAYDALPPEIRKALRVAACNLSSIGVTRNLARNGGDVRQTLRGIAKADKKYRATSVTDGA